MHKKIITLILVACLALTLLAGCGGGNTTPAGDNTIVGDWYADLGSGYECQLSFNEDGSLEEIIRFNKELTTYSGSYTLDGDKVTYTIEGFSSTDTFTIDGEKMTLSNDTGSTEYSRGTIK